MLYMWSNTHLREQSTSAALAILVIWSVNSIYNKYQSNSTKHLILVFPQSFCYCDFYNWADTIGYSSDKKDGWCSTSSSFLSALNTPENDAFGLRNIYRNLGGDFWLKNDAWMSQVSHCEWHGVQCTEGRVTQLDLSSNNLTGNLGFFGKGQNFGNDTGALFELEELYVK
jgi:hypothetical protein